MHLMLCGVLSIAFHVYGMDKEPQPTREYAEVYIRFRQTLKEICDPKFFESIYENGSEDEKTAHLIASGDARTWLRAIEQKDIDTDFNRWKIAKLPNRNTYLIAEYGPKATIPVTPHLHALLWSSSEGWAIAAISETDDDLLLPDYTECAKILELTDIGMHAVAQIFWLQKQWGLQNPSFAGKIGGFWWKIHDTFPPCFVSLQQYDPENSVDQKYPHRILQTTYNYTEPWAQYLFSKTCKTLYTYRTSQQKSDATLQQIKALFIQPNNIQDPRVQSPTRYFFNKHGNVLQFKWTKTIANPEAMGGHIEVEGYHVVAYAYDKGNILLPPGETCKIIAGIDALYVSPDVAKVHVRNWDSDFYYDRLEMVAKGYDTTIGLYWQKHT